jgi:DNA-binding LacI/PurR family transcriptional regulator
MPEKRRITIFEVAEHAGVSRQTVSRVLNDRPDVAPETRQRVKEIIQELGYQPSALARGLSQGTSTSIGVIGYGLEFYGNSRVLSEIETQANYRGYTLALSLMHEPGQNQVDRFLRELDSRHVAGIIWAVPHIGNNRSWLINSLDRISVPIVCVSMEPHPDLSVVEIDNFIGGKTATAHLLENGYQKIGIITGPSTWWAAQQRLEGWKAALIAAGLEINPTHIYEGDWSARSGFHCGKKLLEEHPDIEAIFAGNDQMALGIQKAAINLGLDIPGDLALVGYDNIPESEFFPTALTTIRQGFTDLGRKAIEELERRIKESYEHEEDSPRSQLILPHLIIRQSSIANRR